MKSFNMLALMGAVTGSALLAFATTAAAAQTRTIQGDAISATVTIEAIDQSTRTLTVKRDDGTYETIEAPREMTRFAELKVGQKVTARYYDNVVVRLKKPDEPAVDTISAAVTRGNAATPAVTSAQQRTVTVTVTTLDAKNQSATVTGPNGWVYSRKLADKKAFEMLKVGDRLDMTWTNALLISVDPPK